MKPKPIERNADASLSVQLTVAANVCSAVRAGHSLTSSLARAFAEAPELSMQARGAIQDIAFRTMRRRATADAWLDRVASRLPSGDVRELLVCALALATDPLPAYTPFTLVDQAVAATSRLPGGASKKSFVNAVLRRVLREQASIEASFANDVEAHWNYPAWWIDAVKRDVPQSWENVLRAGNIPAPMTLRVNVRRNDVASYQARLAALGIESSRSRLAGSALRLARPRPVEAIEGFSDGLCSVQDAAAQLAAPLMNVESGMRVLDACAAPGGKTAHILELADCEVLALDVDVERLRRVRQNLDRLGLVAEIACADAAEVDAWWDGRPFDRILADVPCTASGIVRRHPDIRWLRRPADRDQLATTAGRIVDALWRTLAPGGTIVLVTCSIFEHEGESQARRFLDRHQDAVRLSAPGQLLPTASPEFPSPLENDDLDHDGFFYARFAKRPRR